MCECNAKPKCVQAIQRRLFWIVQRRVPLLCAHPGEEIGLSPALDADSDGIAHRIDR
jgi:hypothetical protein